MSNEKEVRLDDDEIASFKAYAEINLTESDGTKSQWADYTLRLIAEVVASRASQGVNAKPTPDQLKMDWKPDDPAVKLVDELLGNRSEEVVSHLDKLWWYGIAKKHLDSVPQGVNVEEVGEKMAGYLESIKVEASQPSFAFRGDEIKKLADRALSLLTENQKGGGHGVD